MQIKINAADKVIAELESKRDVLEGKCREFRDGGLPEAKLVVSVPAPATPADSLQRWLKNQGVLKDQCDYKVLQKVYVSLSWPSSFTYHIGVQIGPGVKVMLLHAPPQSNLKAFKAFRMDDWKALRNEVTDKQLAAF